MKAAVLTGHDKNGRALELRDIPMPKMKDNDVSVASGGSRGKTVLKISE